MIINVRGGSGAGKSTVIRKIMECHANREPHFVNGRKQPLWYDFWNELSREPVLRILGHYESECGGCDTISRNPTDETETAMDFIHRLVREADAAGFNVLYEGVILSTVNNHLLKMVEDGVKIHVVNLTSDLETCLMGISDRRLRKDKGLGATVEEVRKTLGETTVDNNRSKLRSAFKTAHQLQVKGATVYNLDREQAVVKIKELLKL